MSFIPLNALTDPKASKAPWWMDAYGVLMRISLLSGWIPGFTLGLVLMLDLAIRRQIGLAWFPHVQTHGHAQLVGFTGLFFFAVATQVLPRFFGQPLTFRGLLAPGGVCLGIGLLLRLMVQPYPGSVVRATLLLLGGALELVGHALIVAPFLRAARESPHPREVWQLPMLFGFASWVISGILSLWVALQLSLGTLLVAQPLDELTILFGLWGFVLPVTFSVGLRVMPNFLLLKEWRARPLIVALSCYAAGVLILALSWVLQMWDIEQLASVQAARLVGWLLLSGGGLGMLYALRVFEPPARESHAPHITVPTRRWFRIAYGFLVVSLLLGLWLALREWQTGPAPAGADVSAQRHAMVMGYLMPLIVGMAGRILPEFSGEMARHPRKLNAMVWMWLVGAGLRVGGELWGGYTGPGMIPMVTGATVAFIGFAWFSVRVWVSIGRRRPESIGV